MPTFPQDPELSVSHAFSTPYTGPVSNSDLVGHSGMTIKAACAQDSQLSTAYFCNDVLLPLLDPPQMQREVWISSCYSGEHSSYLVRK